MGEKNHNTIVEQIISLCAGVSATTYVLAYTHTHKKMPSAECCVQASINETRKTFEILDGIREGSEEISLTMMKKFMIAQLEVAITRLKNHME